MGPWPRGLRSSWPDFGEVLRRRRGQGGGGGRGDHDEPSDGVRKKAPFREMASHAMVAIFPHMCFGDLMTTQHLD